MAASKAKVVMKTKGILLASHTAHHSILTEMCVELWIHVGVVCVYVCVFSVIEQWTVRDKMNLLKVKLKLSCFSDVQVATMRGDIHSTSE